MKKWIKINNIQSTSTQSHNFEGQVNKLRMLLKTTLRIGYNYQSPHLYREI